MTTVLRGFLQLDTLGNIKVDSNGCVNCIIEGITSIFFLIVYITLLYVIYRISSLTQFFPVFIFKN